MIYKTKHFSKWARKAELPDQSLLNAVKEIKEGLVDADLGGGLFKKRIALPGRGKRGSTRTILATNRSEKWFFLFGFEKNERGNISGNDLEGLKLIAVDLLKLTKTQLSESVRDGALVEVKDEN